VTSPADKTPVTIRNWVAGARPRTLPAAVVPVVVGTGVAIGDHGFIAWRAVLALVVALALQVGVNYANDYSDGIRGTDEVRVGPVRLVASGLARPRQVLAAALACFAVAGAAAWFYTGGSRPYGYRALGEVSVFVFFGLVAVTGTAYVQLGRLTWLSLAAAVPIGLLACALLVINNLRDIPTDRETGKQTLAVVLGDGRTRVLYAACVLLPFAVAAALAPVRVLCLVALAAVPLALLPVRAVKDGAAGRALIGALGQTGRLQLAFGALLTLGLAIRP
jgi:1,4-dihydroxy-2-naphthoate polyprenyltransferase